jgi:hypothetical protein
MTRTAYHRAYYWSRLEARRASARASRRRAREVRAIVKIVCEAVTEARNDKPPMTGGLTGREGGPTLGLRIERDGSLNDCSSRVNHPTTPNHSGISGRETNAQDALNPHRGSHIVGALRKRRGANGSRGDEP